MNTKLRKTYTFEEMIFLYLQKYNELPGLTEEKNLKEIEKNDAQLYDAFISKKNSLRDHAWKEILDMLYNDFWFPEIKKINNVYHFTKSDVTFFHNILYKYTNDDLWKVVISKRKLTFNRVFKKIKRKNKNFNDKLLREILLSSKIQNVNDLSIECKELAKDIDDNTWKKIIHMRSKIESRDFSNLLDDFKNLDKYIDDKWENYQKSSVYIKKMQEIDSTCDILEKEILSSELKTREHFKYEVYENLRMELSYVVKETLKRKKKELKKELKKSPQKSEPLTIEKAYNDMTFFIRLISQLSLVECAISNLPPLE